MCPPDAEIFVLTLCAEPHEVPAIIRLRAALKRLLRDYGLRCVSLTEIPARAAVARAGKSADAIGTPALSKGSTNHVETLE